MELEQLSRTALLKNAVAGLPGENSRGPWYW